MATKNVWAACVAALLVMVFGVVMTSCQGSEDIALTQAAPKTIEKEVPVLVLQDKLVNIISNVYFDGKTIVVGDKVAATVDVNHKNPVIEMEASKHAKAEITASNDLYWNDSNGQETTGTLNIVAGDNYEIFGTLYPAANYSTITKVHPKVSVVNTHHTFEGSVNVTVENDTKSKSFNFDLARQYFLVDPTVDVEIVNTHTTDTLIQVVVKTDTLINTVEVHDTLINNVEVHDTLVVTNTVTVTDTIQVEVERFVKGADIVKSVINDLGFANGTLSLGDKQLLAVEIRHQYPILSVEKDILGSANFSNVAALRWDGTDGQKTTATVNAQGCTVDGVEYLRSEANTLIEGSLVQIRTIYRVYGTYKNENGDVNNFEMELAPSYLQKYEAAPEPQVEEKPMYRGIIRKITVEDIKLMTKPVVQKWNGTTWEDVRTAARCCVGMSGSPSGLDLFVKNTKVIEENEDSWWYTATGTDTDKTWIGDDTKSDGTVISKETKVYQFDHLFAADAVNNGKVGPATQLYVMRASKVQVQDPEGNLLVCTWEDGKEFSLNFNVKVNDTEFVEKAEMKGQTRTESDKKYVYATSFVQHFSASIGGYSLNVKDATSTLWVPAE